MSYLKLHDLNLYYEITGKGKPLVLVPGLSGTCDSFALISHRIAEKFTVISLDNRGAGRSLPEKDGFTVKTMAEDLSALIEYLGFEKVNLLGHSMGGFIAQEYAFSHSNRVEKLILSNTAARTNYRNKDLFNCLIKLIDSPVYREVWHRMFSQWIYTADFINKHPKDYEAAITFSMNYPYHQKPEWFKAQVNACSKFICLAISQLSIPTLIISGEKDTLIYHEESMELKNAFPESKVIKMSNAGHIPMIENKEEYSKIILDFLSAY